MNAVDSAEFTEWLAFWTVEAELQGSAQPEGQREPTREELTGKIHAWVARHNAAVARQAAAVADAPGRTDRPDRDGAPPQPQLISGRA